MAHPRRGSSRARGVPQPMLLAPELNVKLSLLIEREATPENERPNLAAAPVPPKTPTSIPQPTSWATPSPRKVLKPEFSEMHPRHARTTGKRINSPKRGRLATAHTSSFSSNKSISNDGGTMFPSSDVTPFSAPAWCKRPSAELSSDARTMMNDLRDAAARFKQELAAQQTQIDVTDASAARKMATPRGRIGRFSDVHLNEFKKMNSIVNHPSSFRADPSRIASTAHGLKRTNSKADLDKPLDPFGSESWPKAVLADTSDEFSSPAKRVKRQAVGKSFLRTTESSNPSKPSFDRLTSGIPSISQLTTPTKASLARSASVKSLQTGSSRIPAAPELLSAKAFVTPQPTKIGPPPSNGRAHTSMTYKFANGMKSILRRPQIKFSDDPLKIAAGTHFATPKTGITDKPLPAVPEGTPTTPVQRKLKQVNFSPDPDTVFRLSAGRESPSLLQPNLAKSTMFDHQIYRTQGSAPDYPTLPNLSGSASHTPVPAARQIDFTFQAGKTISFAPPSGSTTPTIRRVRASDASKGLPLKKGTATSARKAEQLPTAPQGLSNKKRKRTSEDIDLKEGAETGEDKENVTQHSLASVSTNRMKSEDQDDASPRKKARMMSVVEMKSNAGQKGVGTGKLTKPSAGARNMAGKSKGRGFLSMSRLNALAKPKNRG